MHQSWTHNHPPPPPPQKNSNKYEKKIGTVSLTKYSGTDQKLII